MIYIYICIHIYISGQNARLVRRLRVPSEAALELFAEGASHSALLAPRPRLPHRV